MTKSFIRFSSAVAFAAAMMAAQPAVAATASATATTKVVKPLVMTGGGTINFGTVITPSAATFTGTFTVAASATQTANCAAGFTCSGTRTAAMFNLQGTNNTPLDLTVPLTVSMSGSNGGTLTLNTTNSVATNNATGVYTMSLPNSGSPGVDFYVGGAVTVTEATPGGTFTGTVNVTANYQ